MSETKQVIVINKALNMSKGKLAAQSCHASLAIFTRDMDTIHTVHDYTKFYVNIHESKSQAVEDWLKTSFAKVVTFVNNEQELLDVYNKAKEAGLLCSLITDNGRTEFNGVPTITCCAVGPDYIEKIDPITKHLPLY